MNDEKAECLLSAIDLYHMGHKFVSSFQAVEVNSLVTLRLFIGMKLVRGAYMEKENDRAEEKKYLSPICGSKKLTDENFNAGLRYMVDHLDCMSIFAGTHNEDSTYLLMELMAEKQILNNEWFNSARTISV